MRRSAATHPRVVSLLASATEIVAGLGALGLLVARSHECDFPPEVARLPMVTAPKLDTRRPSALIERDVKRLLEQALAIYRVDGETLRNVAPDLILTQTQCEVCAVTPADVETALAEWTGKRPRIVALNPNSLDDVFADIERVASAIGRSERGAALVGTLRARMSELAERAAAASGRPRVAAIEWLEPLMAGGNWMPELIQMAGGISLFGEAGWHSPWMSLDALAAADPDIVLVLPCGFDIARTRAELSAVERHTAWRSLRALREGRMFLCDGNQYFNRPGPRLVESLEILGEIFHPSLFGRAHEGTGWVPAR
jgi:iron complex transport system substrate-binding protein